MMYPVEIFDRKGHPLTPRIKRDFLPHKGLNRRDVGVIVRRRDVDNKSNPNIKTGVM